MVTSPSRASASGLLYVLNAANGSDSPVNVAGFSVDGTGALHPLANSIRPLSAAQFLYVLDSRLLLAKPGPVTLSGLRIQADGQRSPVVDSASITLPFSAIGLGAD